MTANWKWMLAGLPAVSLHSFSVTPTLGATFSMNSFSDAFVTTGPTNNPIFNATSAGQFQIYWMQNGSWTAGTGTPNAPTIRGITFTSLQNTFIGATNGAANYAPNLLADSEISL